MSLDLYTYPLSEHSRVLEIGGFDGTWTAEIFKRYHCNIWVFEPCQAFFELLKERFKSENKINIINAAVGGNTRIDRITIKGDMTGFFAENPKVETVSVWSASTILTLMGDVDLININCEGAEFEILESLIEIRLMNRIKYIQVQFHGVVPSYEFRYNAIQVALNKTHWQLFSDEASHWQAWERRQ